HVRRVVADELKGLLPTAIGEDLELGRCPGGWGSVSVRQRAGEVAPLPVALDGQGGPSQPRPDGGGGVGAGRAVVEGQPGPIWQLVLHAEADASYRGRHGG